MSSSRQSLVPADARCKLLDYSLPLVEYGTFDTTRRIASALGSTVADGNEDVVLLAPNVGDSFTLPFEFVGQGDCTIAAEATFTRLTAGNQTTSLDTTASLLFNLGADDWRITLRVLPDCFGNVPQFDWVIMPSQMGGAEQFVIQLGADTPPDAYIRGGGAPIVDLPLTATLVWANGNNTDHSAFRYNGRSEVTFRLNGGNNVSNVTSIGLLNGPDAFDYETCDIVDISKRIVQASVIDDTDTFGMVAQTSTQAFTTSNGVSIGIGDSYIEFPNGDTWDAPTVAPVTSTTSTIYSEQYFGITSDGLTSNAANNRLMNMTRTEVGKWDIVINPPHPNGVNYHPSITAEEEDANKDVPDITVIQGSQTANGFSINITTGDNGAASDTLVDAPFTVGISAPVTVITGVSQ